jgi:hypothetical protein
MTRGAWLAFGVGAAALLIGRRARRDGATVTDEAEALARVITSEAHGYSLAERTAIAWAVRNRARKRGLSIARLVCAPTCGPCCEGRPFSSARAPSGEDRDLARRVLAAPDSTDPTDGAVAFFEPRVQDRLVAEGRPGYRFDSDKLRTKWRGEGQRIVAIVGQFEFWA